MAAIGFRKSIQMRITWGGGGVLIKSTTRGEAEEFSAAPLMERVHGGCAHLTYYAFGS